VADSSMDPKQRLLFDDKREIMARICDHWPGMLYHVSECNSVRLLYSISVHTYCSKFMFASNFHAL
jgi:hypothetical protein